MNVRTKWIGLTIVLAVVLIMGVWMMLEAKESKDTASAEPYNGHGGTFRNPLANFDTPDPSVVYKDGYYYMTFTHNGADIMVLKSRSLHFREAEKRVVWYPPVGTMASANLWAPEIQYINGKWYIYYAADDGLNENHRMYVLEADTDDPMGEYTFKGQITDDTNKWAIDGLAMEHEGKLYFVWSGWEGDVNVAQHTYIAPMSNPWTISGPRVKLSSPDLPWEQAGGPPYINEGQSILKKDGRVFIVYSGAGSWTPHYSLGALVLEPGKDPLKATDWTKLPEPLMTMNAEKSVYGPGHNSFVKSPDGTEDWIVYHATSGIADGWNNRKARAQRVEWSEEGLPVFGRPLGLDEAIPVPSGTGIHKAEHAVPTATGGLAFDDIPSTVDTEAPLLIHYTNGSGKEQTLDVSVNGNQAASIRLAATGLDVTGYAFVSIPLQAGRSRIELKAGGGTDVVIQAIEWTRYEAENARTGELGDTSENPFASGEAVVKLAPGEGEAWVLENVRLSGQAKAKLRFHFSNPTEQEVSVEVRIGETGKRRTLTVPPTGRNRFADFVLEEKVKTAGSDITVTLSGATGRLDLDYMDLVY